MIELSRNITFGQYINNGSALTHMDPRVKILGTILLITAISFVNHFLPFAICLLFCCVLQAYSRISTTYVLRSFKPFLPFLAFIYVMEVVFYYSSAPQHVLWHWWLLSVSTEGIITSALTIVRVLLLYYLVSMLMFGTSMVDLTDGLEVLLAPLQKLRIPINPFIMVLVIALKFVPIFITEVERLTKAQAARGVRFDKGNFFQRVQKLAPLLIPLFVSGFKRAETLSIAMEARCYGGRPGWKRSKRRALHLQRSDVLALLFVLLVCSGIIGANFFAPF
jgi:energy-coupling factor transport system permease protein